MLLKWRRIKSKHTWMELPTTSSLLSVSPEHVSIACLCLVCVCVWQSLLCCAYPEQIQMFFFSLLIPENIAFIFIFKIVCVGVFGPSDACSAHVCCVVREGVGLWQGKGLRQSHLWFNPKLTPLFYPHVKSPIGKQPTP